MRNIGEHEKIIRIISGSILLGVGLIKKNWLTAAGALPLITAMLGYCPVNDLLGKPFLQKNRKHPDSTADKSFHFIEKIAEGNDDTGGYRTGKARQAI
jgi:hypothetical protein